MDEDLEFAALRERMVIEQLEGRDIYDERVLDAMRKIPRHQFVDPEHSHLAYQDGPLPIGSQQTISQPYIVALMTQLLGLEGEEKVLEVGTGSGYQAAILALLARQVYSVERFPELAEMAGERLVQLGLENVQVQVGDGSQGLPEYAPYEAIIVTAGAPDVPPALLEQLAEGGRLVIPVGPRSGQFLERWQRRGEMFSHEELAPVAFVPLVGRYGWQIER